MNRLATLGLILAILILCPFAAEAWGMDGPPPGAAETATQPSAPTAPAAPVPATDQPQGKKDEDEPPKAEKVPPSKIPRPTLGRIVVCRFRDKRGSLVERPGIVVNVFENTKDDHGLPLINLQVFTDGSNDGVGGPDGIKWLTSAGYSADIKDATWCWMPYQVGQAAKNDGEVALLRAEVRQLVDHNAKLEASLRDVAVRCGYPVQS